MGSSWEKYHGSEAQFQCSVADYLRANNYLFTHCPNGGNRNRIEAAHLKRQGVSKGVPDLLIFEPRGNYIGLALELKVSHNKPTEWQKQWLIDLSLRGWKCLWSNSLDEVIYEIENYFNNPINWKK